MVESGRDEAEQIVAEAHEERMRLVSQTEVYAQAQHEASRIRAEAEEETRRRRDETDAYVDGKLATFEISLNKTLSAVIRGRERLRDEHDATTRSTSARCPAPDGSSRSAVWAGHRRSATLSRRSRPRPEFVVSWPMILSGHGAGGTRRV